MSEVTQMNDNLNLTEDMMKVNSNEMSKEECFEKY